MRATARWSWALFIFERPSIFRRLALVRSCSSVGPLPLLELRVLERLREVVALPRDELPDVRLRLVVLDPREREVVALPREVVALPRERAVVALPRDELLDVRLRDFAPDERLRDVVALPLDERLRVVVALPRDELLRELLDFGLLVVRDLVVFARPVDALRVFALAFVLELFLAPAGGT